MRFPDIPILLLDIQATAAAASGGTLLEVGWQPYPAASPEAGRCTWLVQHTALDLPPHLARLTGLSAVDLCEGLPAKEIWQRLQVDAKATALAAGAGASPGVCPVVVHYGRFEGPFVDQLRILAGSPTDIALNLICTHEIARRLLPGLPRKGLRAVAGYFGHDTPPQRRCAPHLRATGAIWTGLAEQLCNRHGVSRMIDLENWLKATPVPSRGDTQRHFQIPKAIRSGLPHRPGVYRYLSRKGNPLYVGKAKDLRQRVGTYFQPSRRHPGHILEMLSRAAELKISPTRTTLEAALLEQDLIKRLAPPYNLALQPENGALVYGSKDFGTFSPHWEPRHPLGPLPGGTATAILAELVNTMKSTWAGAGEAKVRPELARALAGPYLEAPDAAAVEAGLGLFRQQHSDYIRRVTPERLPQAIGRRLWIIRNLTPAPDVRPTDSADPQKAEDEGSPPAAFAWTPETVCRHLEHAVYHTAALLRRSRWLRRLGNAVITWGSSDTASQDRRCLILRRGRVVVRRNLAPAAGAGPFHLEPAPTGWHPLDRITYDRLRVATTELRRLVQERRPVSVQLSPLVRSSADLSPQGVVLHRERLAHLLSWF